MTQKRSKRPVRRVKGKPNTPLKVVYDARDKQLRITIGIDTLRHAATLSRVVQYEMFDSKTGDWNEKRFAVPSLDALGRDVVRYLEKEQNESGDTLVHHMFDTAIEQALEQGEESILLGKEALEFHASVEKLAKLKAKRAPWEKK